MTLVFETGGLLFAPSGLALDIDCCCLPIDNCCVHIGKTLYGRMCITSEVGGGQDCNCAGTGPTVPSDATFNWSAINNRWEASFAVGACGTTLNVRITYTFDELTGECLFYYSDDGCTGSWSTPVIVDGPTECPVSCDPYVFTKTVGGTTERYRSCCPGGTWPDGQGPQFVIYGFCEAADRTCDP